MCLTVVKVYLSKVILTENIVQRAFAGKKKKKDLSIKSPLRESQHHNRDRIKATRKHSPTRIT